MIFGRSETKLGGWISPISPRLSEICQRPVTATATNLYAFAGNEPVNNIDPSGLAGEPVDEIVVTGHRPPGGITSGCPSGWYFIGGTCFASTQDIFRDLFNGGGGSPGGGARNQDQPAPQSAPCPAVSPGNMGKMTENQVAASRPGWQVINAYRAARISLSEAQANFPRSQLWNGSGDAWRHFRWNFSMAQSMESRAATAFANAHEVSNPNDAAEHAMDMYNNAMGRAFGNNPAYADLSPSEAADLALRSGCLQTSK